MLNRLQYCAHMSRQLPLNGFSESGGINASGTEECSAQLVLEMLEVSLNQGLSLPRSLAVVGSSLSGQIGECLANIGVRLQEGENWDRVWKIARLDSPILAVVHDVLEPAWKRGVSPALRINSAIEQINSAEHTAIVAASHELSVRILLPLGLCFLPGFIVIAVIPLLSSWQSILG